MGLDTTHNAWHGSYSRFSRWRNALAEAAGWALTNEGVSLGSGGDYTIPEDRIPDMPPRGGYPNGVYLGDWPEGQPEDVLDVLMIHSDCEGDIPHRFTEPLAERLHGLLPKLAAVGDDRDDWREVTTDFICGLMLANSRGEDVGFH